jgi:tetratricopeptide (TPR) repeat protein
VLDHYLHAASVASGFLWPHHAGVARTRPRTGVVLEQIEGPKQAAEWLENEQHVLLAMIGQAADNGYAPYAWELPWVAGWYFDGAAHWQRLAAAQESALAVAARLRDLTGLVTAHQHLGWLRSLLGDTVGATDHLDEAIRLAGQLGDRRLRALAGLSRAHVMQTRDRIPEAMFQAREALRDYHSVGDPQGEARALYAISGHLIQLGENQQAIHFSSRALKVYRESFALLAPCPIACCGN